MTYEEYLQACEQMTETIKNHPNREAFLTENGMPVPMNRDEWEKTFVV